jgi:hypothetical protein
MTTQAIAILDAMRTLASDWAEMLPDNLLMERYHQAALLPGAEPRNYSPAKGLKPAPPEQGHLALDGAVLGPLFDLAKEGD